MVLAHLLTHKHAVHLLCADVRRPPHCAADGDDAAAAGGALLPDAADDDAAVDGAAALLGKRVVGKVAVFQDVCRHASHQGSYWTHSLPLLGDAVVGGWARDGEGLGVPSTPFWTLVFSMSYRTASGSAAAGMQGFLCGHGPIYCVLHTHCRRPPLLHVARTASLEHPQQKQVPSRTCNMCVSLFPSLCAHFVKVPNISSYPSVRLSTLSTLSKYPLHPCWERRSGFDVDCRLCFAGAANGAAVVAAGAALPAGAVDEAGAADDNNGPLRLLGECRCVLLCMAVALCCLS
jgi:hypothetical protein